MYIHHVHAWMDGCIRTCMHAYMHIVPTEMVSFECQRGNNHARQDVICDLNYIHVHRYVCNTSSKNAQP